MGRRTLGAEPGYSCRFEGGLRPPMFLVPCHFQAIFFDVGPGRLPWGHQKVRKQSKVKCYEVPLVRRPWELCEFFANAKVRHKTDANTTAMWNSYAHDGINNDYMITRFIISDIITHALTSMWDSVHDQHQERARGFSFCHPMFREKF